MARLKRGDIFLVPLGDGRVGAGQVVGGYGKDAYYFAIFDAELATGEATARAAELATRPVLFLTLSLDAKVHVGHWEVVARAPVSEEVKLPAYKEALGTSDSFAVVDYSGTRHRPATQLEAQALPNRKIVAPVRLEKALRAWFGLEPWLDAYEELRPGGGITSEDIFGQTNED